MHSTERVKLKRFVCIYKMIRYISSSLNFIGASSIPIVRDKAVYVQSVVTNSLLSYKDKRMSMSISFTTSTSAGVTYLIYYSKVSISMITLRAVGFMGSYRNRYIRIKHTHTISVSIFVVIV